MDVPLPLPHSNSTQAIDNVVNALQDLNVDGLDAEVGSTGSFELFHMAPRFDEAQGVTHQTLTPPNMPEAQTFGVPGVPGGWSGATSEMHGQGPCRDEEAQGEPLAEITHQDLGSWHQGSSEAGSFRYPYQSQSVQTMDFTDHGAQTDPMHGSHGVQTPHHGPAATPDWPPRTYYNTFLYYYHVETAWPMIIPVTSVQLYRQPGTDYLYEIHM
jgi:hypothetical protein